MTHTADAASSEIVDVYEMTSVQAGMLFHSLHSPENAVYFQQYWCTFHGALDLVAFRDAWNQVIARHDILRSQPHWEDLEAPVHVIHDQVRPDWQFEDWQSGRGELSEQAQTERLQSWLEADRHRGFDMGSVPLMRFALIATGPDQHVFVWSFHHLLFDGWCGAILVREMLEAYGGGATEAASAPFRQYVEWLSVQDPAAAQAYWARTLAGMEATTPLGIDQARTGDRGAAEHRSHLPLSLTRALDGFAKEQRLTLNTLMQGAWALILSRYTGLADVCLGTVLSGRPPELPGVEDMIGLFLNTVPTRILAQDQPLLPWLHEIQTEQRHRERFGYASLNDIQGWSGLGAATPLFESLLIVETYPQSIETVVAREGRALRMQDTGIHERTNYPLTLKILPGEEIEISLTADASRLTVDALARLSGHLLQVLQAFVTAPECTLDKIALTSPAEQTTMLAMGRGPCQPPAPLCLSAILQQGDLAPTRRAICGVSGLTLTYGELVQRSGEIAATLQACGVQRGDVVAVFQDRTPDLVATLMAIWRLGAAYLPLDPVYPAERIAFILSDAAAEIVVTDATSRGALVAVAGVSIVDVAECCGEQVASPVDVEAADMAYILYTSGSTGTPKGVCISHGALANFIGSMRRAPGLLPDAPLLALTTVSFDIAALELFGPLCVGGLVVLGDSGLGADGARIAELLETHGIQQMQATPSGWRVLLEAGWTGRKGAAPLTMLSGGEPLDTGLARRLLQTGGVLWNLYGPTETTIWSSALRLDPGQVAGAKTPVGGALDNTQLYVLDRAGQVAPIGVAGELLIGGDGLAQGYHNRADLTKDRFIPNPVTQAGRVYRTGDNVRWQQDGTLEFMGRLDDQVKLRGFRIELGEIETRLEAHAAIRQAVAMVRDEDGSPARLVGYLRLQTMLSEPQPDAAELRRFLGRDLPAYMIPSAWVMMTDFPLTPNGKINRRALPAPELKTREPAQQMPVENSLVAAIWCDFLNVDEIGEEDNFFDLGGHSLLATRLISTIEQALNVKLRLRDLFDAPDFGAFCARVNALKGQDALAPLTPATGAPVLSYAQQRQWLMAQFDPEDTAYVLPLAVDLHGPLDLKALQRAFDGTAAKHEILRQSFPVLEGQSSILLHPKSGVILQQTDLTPLAAAEQDARLLTAQQQEARIPFDITAAPPWRARIFTLGDQRHVMLLTLHHILVDEWSFALLLKEISQAYAKGTVDISGPAELQYGDFAAWQRDLDLTAQRDFWRWQLEGVPPLLPLPTDFKRPTQRNAAGGRVPVQLSAELFAQLRNYFQSQRSTVFMGLLAVYAVFLHRHMDWDDIVIGTPVSNRQVAGAQDMIGLFVNTLAIRSNFEPDLGFEDLLIQVRERVLAAHAHQDIPFEQVIDALDLPRNESHAPLVQTLFSLQNPPKSGALSADVTWSPRQGEAVNARFDLSLVLQEAEHGLIGYFEYAGDLFAAETVQSFAQRFETLVQDLVDHAGQGIDPSVSDLRLLPPQAHRGQASPDGSQSRASLWELIDTQDPHRIVLRWGKAHWTYETLQTAAMQFGAARGTLPDGICDLLAALHARPSELDISNVLVATSGLSRLAHLGVSPTTRLLWNGRLDAEGVYQIIAALVSGATLVDHDATMTLHLDGDILTLTGAQATQRYYSPLEMPLAFAMDADGTLIQPLGGTVAYTLDRAGQVMPSGTEAELCLTGVGLSRGYAADPAKTAQRFVPNAHVDPQDFRPAESCIWRSDMLVRRERDGRFTNLGLRSTQLRIGGQPMQPAALIAAICGHPGIKEAALKYRDTGGLEAVLVPETGQAPPDAADLRRYLEDTIADYLMPRHIHWVDQIPRDEKGGVDQAAVALVGALEAVKPPQGDLEIEIATIWSAVLRVDSLNRHDNFFDLGGDSILAMQIVTRLREAGYRLEPRELFQHQTIAALAEVLQHALAQPDQPEDSFELPDIDDLDLALLEGSVSFGD